MLAFIVFYPEYVFRTTLKPVSDDAVVLAGLGPGKGEAIHLNEVAGEVQITLHDIQLRNIPAQRS